ncbi:MAG: TonB-dependent receptor domain-containing protein [Bryobacteraceae bacterium]
MKPVFQAVIAAISIAAALFGQAESGTIVGLVSDQGGAVVQGARITLVNEGTGSTRVATTNGNGQYVAYSIPTGRVTVSVEHPGFQKLVRTGIELTAADTLTVGSVQETVEVTGEATLLQSQTAAISTLISNRQIVETPLNGRSFTQLLPLSTGAAPTVSSMQSAVGAGQRANVAISVNGSVANKNTYLIDGITNRDNSINYLIFVPALDSIQEVRVLTSNFTAEYGAAAGAITLVQSKSGTNQYHGVAYEFLRNNIFDANTFFNNRAGLAKPPFHRNEFGGTIGGPIRHDKTFIFGDYQGTRIRQPVTTVDTIPTLAQQRAMLTGDFSSFSATIYNPYSVTGPAGSPARNPFPGNQIPRQLLDPVAGKLVGLPPAPNQPGATRNYVFNPPNSERDDQFDIRVDQNLGASDRLFVKYSYYKLLGLTAGTLPPGPNPSLNVGQYLTGGGTTPLAAFSTTLNYTKVFSANLIDEARAGVVRTASTSTLAPGSTGPLAAQLGVPGINISDRSGGLPGYQLSGYQTIGNTAQSPAESNQNYFQYENTLTWVKGTHTLKFGARYIRDQYNGFTAIAPRGWYTFNGQFTRHIGTSAGGSVLADFALGAFNGVTRSVQFGVYGMRNWETGFFAEDDWRVTNRLTLTYGLRHEMQSPPYEVNNRWTDFDIKTGGFRVAGVNGNSRTLRTLDTGGFGPRLGVTYLLTGDGKTVLRTGGGIAYVESFNNGKQLHQNPPLTVQQAISADQNGAPPFTISAGLPLPVVPDLNNAASYNGNATEYDPNLKLTRSMQWSVGIQRELFRDVLLDVSYVGSRTLGLINSLNENQAIPGPGAFSPRRPLYGIDPLLQDVDFRTNWGASKYHSMQTKLQKRFSKGLTASLAWTWSHNLANAREPATSTRPENSYCTKCEWGNALEDRRHMVVVNHVYELPFGAGREFANSGLLARIAGGWTVSGTWTMYTGQWFAPALAAPVSNANSNSAAITAIERPNWASNPNLPNGQRTVDAWFKVSAFAIPAQYTFGNAGLGIIEGPGYFNTDLGIHRDFAIRERYRLTFRWELFNALNRPNFVNPDATIGASTAGTISSTLPARSMQFALKLNF